MDKISIVWIQFFVGVGLDLFAFISSFTILLRASRLGLIVAIDNIFLVSLSACYRQFFFAVIFDICFAVLFIV